MSPSSSIFLLLTISPLLLSCHRSYNFHGACYMYFTFCFSCCFLPHDFVSSYSYSPVFFSSLIFFTVLILFLFLIMPLGYLFSYFHFQVYRYLFSQVSFFMWLSLWIHSLTLLILSLSLLLFSSFPTRTLSLKLPLRCALSFSFIRLSVCPLFRLYVALFLPSLFCFSLFSFSSLYSLLPLSFLPQYLIKSLRCECSFYFTFLLLLLPVVLHLCLQGDYNFFIFLLHLFPLHLPSPQRPPFLRF